MIVHVEHDVCNGWGLERLEASDIHNTNPFSPLPKIMSHSGGGGSRFEHAFWRRAFLYAKHNQTDDDRAALAKTLEREHERRRRWRRLFAVDVAEMILMLLRVPVWFPSWFLRSYFVGLFVFMMGITWFLLFVIVSGTLVHCGRITAAQRYAPVTRDWEPLPHVIIKQPLASALNEHFYSHADSVTRFFYQHACHANTNPP
jgi:hypothetical protein